MARSHRCVAALVVALAACKGAPPPDLRTLFGATMGHVDDFTLAPGALARLAWR